MALGLFDADDDWIEDLRRLVPVVGDVYPEQHVRSLPKTTVEEFEKELEEAGFRRNWLAYYKRFDAPVSKHNLGSDKSAGSWTLKDGLLADYQLHITLFPHIEGGVAVYAHLEYNALKHPLKHLQEERFSPKHGRRLAREVLFNDGTDRYRWLWRDFDRLDRVANILYTV